MPEDELILSEAEASTLRSVVCRLLGLSSERPDIQSTVRALCKNLKVPLKGDERRVKKLLRYLQGTRRMGTRYRRSEALDINVYTDSDWACDKEDRKSVSGCIIMVGDNRFHSHSRGQATISLSSCEAEVVAATEAAKEGLFIQRILEFLDFGRLKVMVWIDASSAQSFFHHTGMG